MNRYLFFAILALAAATTVQTIRIDAIKQERNRLQTNQQTLLDSVGHYKTAAGKEAASVQVLKLKVSELQQYKADAVQQIRDLGIRLRRVEATAAAATKTEVQITTPIIDTIYRKPSEQPRIVDDSMMERVACGFAARGFRWNDGHVRLEGIISEDSVTCSIRSIDTLRQVIHRVPRRFLFIRWGTKAIRQEIVSSNPHSSIIYAEYIDLKRGRE